MRQNDRLMDILLVDDKEGEGALLHREWQHEGVRTHQAHDLNELLAVIRGQSPTFDAVIIDLDLGRDSSGAAGGLQAISAISRWQAQSGSACTIALRTQDVDDDRSLSAVLAAELLGCPLPLWGKRPEDAHALLAYLSASSHEAVNPTDFGGVMVHPVRFVKEERGEVALGEYLFGGQRGQVWTFLFEGYDADVAVLYAGYQKRNKFWDQVKIGRAHV